MPKTVRMPKVMLVHSDWAVMVREGWAVFNIGAAKQGIQRDDERKRFAADDDAIAHVMTKALTGSPTHIKALVLHLQGLTERIDALFHQYKILEEEKGGDKR